VLRVERLLREQDWNFLFPQRNPDYTYRHAPPVSN
jgi:hypothetical protein